MSFPRYPKYKDSGVAWLGEVPEHWKFKSLRRLVESTNAGEVIDKTFWGGSSELLYSCAIDPMDCDFKDFPEWKRTTEMDLLLTRNGTPYIHKPVKKSIYTNVVQRVTLMPGNDRDFLAIAIQNSADNLKGYGVSIESLNYEMWKSLPLVIPPTAEQTRIAAFLDRETAKIDGLIAEQQRLIDLLKEKRQAVISHAVIKGLNPQAPMKPSGIEWLGDVPAHWSVNKLGRAVFMQEGPGLRTWQFTDEGTRVICVTNITEGGIDFSLLEKFISLEEYNSSYRHFTVNAGDILLSSSGNSWGKVAIYNGQERVILNTSTIRINERDTAPLSRDYIALLLQSVTVREQLELAMTGSCQPNFGPTHLNRVMVAIPPRNEQRLVIEAVSENLAKLNALISEAQRAINLLHERRTALISAAVTGQIDVRRYAETTAA